MTFYFRMGFVLLALVFLAGCSASPAVLTPTVQVPVILPSYTPSPTITEIPSPSPTRAPTPIGTPIHGYIRPTPFSTDDALETTRFAKINATQQMFMQLIGQTQEALGEICPKDYQVELSTYSSVVYDSSWPWFIFTCTPLDKNYSKRYTVVLNGNHTKKWIIPHKDFKWSQRPQAMLKPWYWTKDGKQVYLRRHEYFIDGFVLGDLNFLLDAALYRLDLETGQFETILPEEKGWYAFALSPDEHFLAVADETDRHNVQLRDALNNAILKRIWLPSYYAVTGNFVWSKDGTVLIFSAAQKGWLEGKAGTSIFKLNMKTMGLRLLVDNDRRLLASWPWLCDGKGEDSWVEKNVLKLFTLRQDDHSEWTLNIDTGAIKSFQPTRIPTYTPTP